MKRAWPAWVRRLRRCFQLLPGLPARVRRELAALHHLEAEVSRIATAVSAPPLADNPPSSATLVAGLADLVQRLHGEHRRELDGLAERLHREVNEQFLLLDQVAREGRRHAAEGTLRSQLSPPPARAEGLSILIPCWNQGCFLAEAVASALASLDVLDGRGEVLILDDASRDQTRQQAQELARGNDRVRLLVSDENLGLPRAAMCCSARPALNTPFPSTPTTSSSRPVSPPCTRRRRQPAPVLAYGNVAVRDEAGRVLGLVSNDRVTPQLLDGNYIDALVLVRTGRVLELKGYDTEARLPGLEDWELHVRLLHGGEPLVFVPTLVGLYRSSPLSMNHDVPCITSRSRRLWRVYGLNGRLPAEAVCASVYHPATGYLWRSPAWQSRPAEPAVAHGRQRQTTGLRLLVVSSAGVRNHGDDAILLSTLQRLQRVRPGCVPVVLTDGACIPLLGRLGRWAGTVAEACRSLDPAAIRHGCQNHPLPNDLPEQVGAGQPGAFAPVDFSSLDAVLFAGGGNLNDYWPNLTAQRTALAAVALAHGVPYVVSGQGIGPVTGTTRNHLALLVAGAKHFGVRDPLSLADLRRLPVSCDYLEVVGDDALGLASPPPGLVDRLLEEVGVPPHQPLLGFHAREANYVGFTREDLLATAAQVDELAAQHGQAVVCLPINTQPWAPEAALLASLAASLKRRRARWFLVDGAERVEVVAGLVGRCAAVVSHSYHVALFAFAAGVPALLSAGTEYYRLKAEGLRQFFQVPAGIALASHADSGRMAEQLRRMSGQAWSPLGSAAGTGRLAGSGTAGPADCTGGKAGCLIRDPVVVSRCRRTEGSSLRRATGRLKPAWRLPIGQPYPDHWIRASKGPGPFLKWFLPYEALGRLIARPCPGGSCDCGRSPGRSTPPCRHAFPASTW